MQPGSRNISAGNLLEVRGLQVSFATEHGDVQAVRDLSFDVRNGEVLSIVGESGSGKTVSILSLLGLTDRRTTRTQGSVHFRGQNVLGLPDHELRRIRGRDIALISQDPMTALTPVHTIGFQIIEQIRTHQPLSRPAARGLATDLLRSMGMPDPERAIDRFPHQLSGGMRQRVVIAMALSCSPALLVADEPTTALDVTVQAQVLDLLRRLRADYESSIILITHDMGVVGEMADRVMVMYAGRVVEQGAVDQLFQDAWHPYTWGLLASIPPLHGARPTRLFSIPGTPPSPAKVGPGCGFASRCAFRRAVCDNPPPRMSSNSHEALCFIPPEQRPVLRQKVLQQRSAAG